MIDFDIKNIEARLVGANPDLAIKTLMDAGYKVVDQGADFRTLAKPGADYAVRLSKDVPAAQAFAALCDDLADNEYLPNVFGHFTAGDDLHVTLIEPLRSLDDFEEGKRVTMGGLAHAMAAFIEGDEIHQQVHAMMMGDGDSDVTRAARGIVKVMADNLANGGQALCYDPARENIRFRAIDENCARTVYAAPFRSAVDNADAVRAQIAHISKRFDLCQDEGGKHAPAPVSPILRL